MDAVENQLQSGTPGSRPAPGRVGRLNGIAGGRQDTQPVSQASRNALRHARDVLADFMQRDSKD